MKDNGNILHKYFNQENLKLSWERVNRWQEKTVKDQFGIKTFRYNLDENLKTLSQLLLSGIYVSSKPEKFFVPKSSKMQRTKTVLCIEDALVYQAIANIIAVSAYDKVSKNNSFVFGSVLNPETKLGTEIFHSKNESNFFFFQHWKMLYPKFKDAVVKAITQDKVTHKFITDITGFFDSIPHYNLLEILSREFKVEDEILDMLSECFNTWSGTKHNATPGVGIPQGPGPSHLFANLLLYPLDEKIVAEAYKYYRYMDDIHIYGYSENELLKVLVDIDSYLKGNALSLNAKKTTIESVVNDESDPTIKEFIAIDFSYSELESDDNNDTLNFDSLAEQDNSNPLQEPQQKIKTLSDEKEIIAFWENEIKEVEKELPKYFRKNENGETTLKDKEKHKIEFRDTDFIRLSAKYGISLRELGALEKVSPSDKLLDYWIIVFKTFFWRADKLYLTLMQYKNNKKLKTYLLNDLLQQFDSYEWVRYYIYGILGISQSFTDKELREVFKILKTEKSNFAKLSLYKILIFHTNDKQFISSIVNELGNETNLYLRKSMLDYIRMKEENQFTVAELMESFGL